MKAILRLIRFQNLIIIGLTMCMIRYFLVGKLLDLRALWLGLSDLDFLVLTLSVLFIAAGGYIVNDYFDLPIDAINKPEQIVIGRNISKNNAFKLYITLTVIGAILSLYVSYKVNNLTYCLINLSCAGLLWFYSNTYKKTLLIGNIVIAVLSGLVPLLVAIYEPNKSKTELLFVSTYAGFAFVISLIREIIKDIEDIEGDKSQGANTLPIATNIGFSKLLVFALIVSLLYFLGYVEYNQYITQDVRSLWYFIIAISVPLLLLGVGVVLAKEKVQFHRLSQLSKFIMLTGIFSTLVFYYSF